MTASEKLRSLLDERGVEWRERVWGGKHSVTTFWHARGVRWHYRENRFGELRLHADGLAPEQAIDATLGSCNCSNGERTNGTCHMRLAYEEEDADGFIWPDHYECSVCGANVNGIMPSCDTEVPPRFCPNCGRKVVNL